LRHMVGKEKTLPTLSSLNFRLVPNLQIGNAMRQAPAWRDWKLKLPRPGFPKLELGNQPTRFYLLGDCADFQRNSKFGIYL
jgi:hypothetical protein